MNWTGKRVLITGAAGFVGSHLAEQLVHLGATVTAFLRQKIDKDCGLLAEVPDDVRKSICILYGDVRDFTAVDRAVRGQQTVFHLAALVGIPNSYLDPLEYIQTNTLGSSIVFDACRRHSVSKVVHTSTSNIYGESHSGPVSESHPAQGNSPYAASKIAAEQFAFNFCRSFDLPIAIVRPFNTYGPRQSLQAIIPTVISQALQKNIVQVGSIWPTRDLTFVTDTVRGILQAAESPKSVGEAINIGSGTDVSIGNLVERILRLVGRDVQLVTDPQRVRPVDKEAGRLFADIEKAKTLLNWQPTVSLDEGLQSTIDWMRGHLSRFADTAYRI